MALDMERPSSVHSPEQHSLSGLSRRPSSEDRRSTSPEDRSSPASGDTARHRPGAGPPAGLPLQPATALKFSIEKILSPDFGRQAGRERRDSPREAPASHLSDKQNHTKEAPSLTGHAVAQNENAAPARGDSDVQKGLIWPAWCYCTRFSDRPSSGPRSRRMKKKEKKPDEKRPRTAFTAEQLARLKQEFNENRYLTEKRRQDLARDLKLNDSQVKIWFQNKRAKLKKASPQRNPLALQLMAQGLYNHSTVAIREDEEDDERPKSSSSS